MYVVPNMDYCKHITKKYLCTGDFDETLSLVQINLYKYIETYNPQKPILTWLHICIKRYVNRLNKESWGELTNKASIDKLKDNKELPIIPSDHYFETGDFDKLGILFFADPLYHGLKSLKPIDREILLLHYVDGYDYPTIAKIKNLTIGQVKSNAFLSLHMLRYKVTGIKPPSKYSIFHYMQKSLSLNRAK